MSGNIKALGLVMAAIFAVSAVTAQAAFGAEEFHTHAKHIVITGEQHPQFPNQLTTIWVGGVEKSTITCKKLEIKGDSEGTETKGEPTTWTSPELTVHPVYRECASSFGEATVNTNECHYKFTAATTEEHAEVHVICPTGQSIETSIAGCIIKIGEQTIRGIHYTNVNTTSETNKKELTVHTTTGKTIHYTTNGAFACTLGGVPSSGTEGETVGTTTLRAKEYVSGNTKEGYVDGEQVGIWKQ